VRSQLILEMLNKGKAKDAVSPLLDPFKKESLERFMIHGMKLHYGNFRFYGSVKFLNGDTGGEQRFEGNTFEEVYNKMIAFLKTL